MMYRTLENTKYCHYYCSQRHLNTHYLSSQYHLVTNYIVLLVCMTSGRWFSNDGRGHASCSQLLGIKILPILFAQLALASKQLLLRLRITQVPSLTPKCGAYVQDKSGTHNV